MQKILYDIKGFIGIHWHDDKFRKLLTCETRGRVQGSCNYMNNTYLSRWEVTIWLFIIYSLYLFVWQIFHNNSKISINYLLYVSTVGRAASPWVSHIPTCLAEYAKNT